MNKFGDPDFKGLNCIGYETIIIFFNTVAQLTPPPDSLSAIVVLVKASGSPETGILAFFREDGINPTITEGMPMTDLTRYGVLKGNLNSFRIIPSGAGSHTLRVQYYG